LQNARIVLDDFEVILHSADSIASVGILHPLAFHVEAKPGSSSSIDDGTIAQESSSCLYEVNGDTVQTDVEDKQTRNPTTTSDAYPSMDVCISKTGKTLFSIGCWIGEPSSASKGAYACATYFHLIEQFMIPPGRNIFCPFHLAFSNPTYYSIMSIGLKADLVAVLSRIQNQLKEDGLSWANVLYVHLYISSMKEFALANEVYVSFITEKKCHLGVPSRSTIELPLVQAGLGNAYVEVLVSNDLVKRVLHVQSISCWAPSCIGPYSQVKEHSVTMP
jgi:diphthine-ammonia ligase